MAETKWINTEKPREGNLGKKKPCLSCGYCPYGSIVEMFPLHPEGKEDLSCNIFGHDCPMYYNAEDIMEDAK